MDDSLKSILAINKDFDWEILIGDDGSTDGTLKKVQHYVDLHPGKIFVYVMTREVGKTYDSIMRASANRLNLLLYATGDYFCVLDGDDYYCDKNFVNEALKIFKTHSAVSVVGFNFVYFQKKDLFYGENKLPSGAISSQKYLRYFYTPGGACVHKKVFDNERIQLLQKCGFYDDNDIVVNSLNYGNIYIIDRAVYAYRQTGQSVWTSLGCLERNVINAIAADEELEVSNGSLREDILSRYVCSYIYIYLNKGRVQRLFNPSKKEGYLLKCQNLSWSFARDILMYDRLSIKEKVAVNFFIFKILAQNFHVILIKIFNKVSYYDFGL